jgi:aminopeptidase N
VRRARVALVAAVAAVAVAGCTAPPAPVLTGLPSETPSAIPSGAGPGSDGVGDSYYPTAGNGGYDVGNYDLNLVYDPEARELTGVATITASATQGLTSFNLDFTGLDPESITVDGSDAEWEHDAAELVVQPATPIANGATFTTVVAYSGRPSGYSDPSLGETGFLTSAEGAIAIGEPEVAATWFPVNDHPRDKATYTIRISVPDSLEALSNGRLLSKEEAERVGYTTWTWREGSPMAPYLATVVIGNYRVQESTHGALPVLLAVHTSLPTTIDDQLARTPEVIDYLQTVFGPYPFDAMGGIVINDPRVGFALENQSRPIYASGFFRGGDASWVLAHELGHQWYGDSVSVHDWSEIWLNEGFATYAEWLWSEHQGLGTAQETFDDIYQGAGASMWSVPPGDPGRARLFDGSVYTRGGMTLQALRITVGDEAFFRILPEWAKRKAGSSATTQEFIALAEEISGRQLDQLFQDWLYGTQRPPRP